MTTPGSSSRSFPRRWRGRSAPLFACALLAAGCSSATVPTAAPKPSDPKAESAAPKLKQPARYVLTQSQGAIFDEATKGAAVPRQEPALVMGRRVTLEGGVVIASARAPSGLVGFRSLPARLGGGYLVWSDVRTYHAKDFLGALTPVAEIGPTAGARPWFSSVLLRTERGVLELDMKTHATKRWRPQYGLIDALALDEKRAVTLDVFGRVRSTADAGATWTDVSATRGYFANAARLGRKGEIELVSLTGSADFRFLPGASGVEPTPPPPPAPNRRYYGYSGYPYSYVQPPYTAEYEGESPISQTLAPDALLWATSAGLPLEGERAIVGRDDGVVMLSTRTGAELTNTNLLGVESQYGGCQPVRSGSTILLACAHQTGAEVLVLDGPLGAPKLEATFPDTGGFVSDEHGHLAFTGRCGRTPPSADDFGARVAKRAPPDDEDYSYYGGYGPYGGYGGYNPEYEPPDDSPPEKEKPPADDKRICVRLQGGDWIEHRIKGDDAKDVYRWVLGDDGEVTALLLEGANPEDEEEDQDGDKPGDHDGDDDDLPLRRKRSEHSAPAADRSALASPTVAPNAPKPPPPPPGKGSGPKVVSGKPDSSAKPSASAKPAASAKPSASAKPDASAKPAASAKPDASAKPAGPKGGLHLVRLDLKDRVLRHGKWPHVPPPLTQAPWRSIDQSFWLEDDGSIRGWVWLDAESGAHESGPPMPVEDDEKPSPVTTDTTGRFAGVRISPQGKATVLPLPAHVQSVLFGGRFGMARSEDESGDKTTYFETTDGGATWTEIEGPPIGEMEDVYDESRLPACSALGCVLGSGMVRLGWGSPKPAPPKKEKEAYAGPGADSFPVPRMPKLECTFESEPDAFPAPPPKPKTDGKEPVKKPPQASPGPAGIPEDVLSQLPPDLQEMLRNGGSLPPGMMPPIPSAVPAATAAPVAKPPGSAKPNASASPKSKPGKPPPPPKPPPAPPAEIVSMRSKGPTLGQIKDKNWVADFIVPFDPTAGVKHASVATNGLEKVNGSVVPVIGDRGVDLLLSFDKRRAVLGSASPSLLPFEYSGKLVSAVALAGASGAKGAAGASSSIVALDDDKRVLVLLQQDASRSMLRLAKIPDPTRGKFALARRVDAPGAAIVWLSTLSGEVLVGTIDLGRAEIAPLAPLASLSTLLDAGLSACSAKPSGPTYQFLAEVAIPVNVTAHSGKTLFNEGSVASALLVRASADRLCVAGVEVKGGGRPLDLSASFGPKPAAVARSRTSAEDATKISIEKLSCTLKEAESK